MHCCLSVDAGCGLRSYPGKWHGVSGGIEVDTAGLELPVERALKEIEARPCAC
jgi:hypothetical protein